LDWKTGGRFAIAVFACLQVECGVISLRESVKHPSGRRKGRSVSAGALCQTTTDDPRSNPVSIGDNVIEATGARLRPGSLTGVTGRPGHRRRHQRAVRGQNPCGTAIGTPHSSVGPLNGHIQGPHPPYGRPRLGADVPGARRDPLPLSGYRASDGLLWL